MIDIEFALYSQTDIEQMLYYFSPQALSNLNLSV